MASSTISNVLTTTIPSAAPSNSESSTPLTSKQISIIIGVTCGVLVFLLLFFVVALRLWRQRRYDLEPPEDNSKCMDAVESQETIVSNRSNLSIFKFAEADPLITATTESQQVKSAYSRPNSSVNKNYYAGVSTRASEAPTLSLDFTQSPYHAGVASREAPTLSLDFAQSPLDDVGSETATLRPYRPDSSKSTIKLTPPGVTPHEPYNVSLDVSQYPIDNVGFETAALRPYRPSPSKSKIKLPPLIIPENIPFNVNGDGSTSKSSTVSRTSSKPLESGWELDSNDSASLYSEASATSTFSKSSLETIRPPPVPPIPIRFSLPTQSKLPKSPGVNIVSAAPRLDEDESINKILPPLPSLLPLPSFKFHGDNGEDEDETQIYNVAKLLQSRQSKLPQVPKDAVSRNASLVSHIERSGSISVVISPEESYRPRYYRLKQKRDKDDSFSSNLSSHMSMSMSMVSSARSSLVPPQSLRS